MSSHPGPARWSAVLPHSSAPTSEGHLSIGGCDTVELAERFGTPLYVFDQESLRAACRACRAAFVAPWPANSVHYAGKAYLAPWVCEILADERLSLDVFSGDDLHLAGGFARERMRFHGLHRSPEELEQACRAGVGAVVVDDLGQLDLLVAIGRRLGRRQPVLLRLATGLRPHTGAGARTGTLVSTFGLDITGVADEAVRRCLAASDWLDLRGYHTHCGTQITTAAPFGEVAKTLIHFVVEMDERHGYWPAELSPGGGFALPYTAEEVVPSPADLAAAVMAPIVETATSRGRALPAVSVEPGRSLIGRAGVALYSAATMGTGSAADGFIRIDGGLVDTLRPALYAGPYTLGVLNRGGTAGERQWFTVRGRTGAPGADQAGDGGLPPLRRGDVLAVPCVGAYGLRTAKGERGAVQPEVVVVGGGVATLVTAGDGAHS